MGLDALIAELTRTAEAESEAMLSAARARALAIQRAANEDATRRREAGLRHLADANRRALARETAAAERENRLTVLAARAQALDAVFARATELLMATDAARYRDGVGALVDSTLKYLEGAPAILRCRPDVAVTIRERDSMAQVRVPIEGVVEALRERLVDVG